VVRRTERAGEYCSALKEGRGTIILKGFNWSCSEELILLS
jgi:hypothetical protein